MAIVRWWMSFGRGISRPREKKIESLEAKSPGSAEWRALSGAADYLEGRYSESLANLNAALKKRPGDSEWLELRLHVRQTQTALKGFKAHKTEHFDIWYEPGEDAVFAALSGQYAGEGLCALRRGIGRAAQGPDSCGAFLGFGPLSSFIHTLEARYRGERRGRGLQIQQGDVFISRRAPAGLSMARHRGARVCPLPHCPGDEKPRSHMAARGNRQVSGENMAG